MKDKKESKHSSNISHTLDKWLSAAREGDCQNLDEMLKNGQDIDEVISGKTALQAAIHAGKKEAVNFLLDKDADPGVLTLSGTALTIVIQKQDVETFKRLLGTEKGQEALSKVSFVVKPGIATSTINHHLHIPILHLCIEYEQAFKDERPTQRLANMIAISLMKRPPLWSRATKFKTELDSLCEFYSLYQQPRNSAHNRNLLNYAIARLTGNNLYLLLANTGKDEHLKGENLAILICGLLNIDAHSQHGVSLPKGWSREEFLIVRIAILFELLCKWETGEPYDLSSIPVEKACDRLRDALLIDLEILRTAREINLIQEKVLLPAGREKCFEYIAKKLIEKISTIPDGCEYSFATGYQLSSQGIKDSKSPKNPDKHCVYISWMRRRHHIFWRIDNLSKADKEYHGWREVKVTKVEDKVKIEHEIIYIKPALLGYCLPDDFNKPERQEYLIKLVKHASPNTLLPSSKGKEFLYKESKDIFNLSDDLLSEPIRKDFQELPAQANTNCFIKSHEQGFRSRLGNSELISHIETWQLSCVKEWCELRDPPKALEDIYPLDIKRTLPSHMLEHIRGHYQQQASIRRLFPDPKDIDQPIDENYIHLALTTPLSGKKKVPEDKKVETKESKQIQPSIRDVHLRNLEDIYHKAKSQTILPEKIWNQGPGNTTNYRVVISGPAGSGKSTFCQYVAYQWAKPEGIWSSDFDHLFWIKLRSLKDYNKQDNNKQNISDVIVDVLEENCLPARVRFNGGQHQFLKQKINQSRVLWLLDGYDEVTDARPGSMLEAILNFFWQQQRILLTTRPHAESDIQQKLSQTVTLELLGFTDDNIVEFINKFFPKPTQIETREALIYFLKQRANIWGLAHTPVNLELICHFWQSNIPKPDQISLTALYQNLTHWLMERDIKKRHIKLGKRPKEDRFELVNFMYQREQRVLAQLAFGMYKGQIVEFLVSEEELMKVIAIFKENSEDQQWLKKQVLNFGVLHTSNKRVSNPYYDFIHLTFQEYYAARHIAYAYTQDKESSIYKTMLDFTNKEKYNPNYQIIWRFVAGVLHTEYPDIAHRFFERLLQPPRQIIPTTERELWLRCLEEAPVVKGWTSQDAVKKKLVEWMKWVVSLDMRVRLWVYESPLYDSVINAWMTAIKASPRIVVSASLLQHQLKILQNEKSDKKMGRFQKRGNEDTRIYISNFLGDIGPSLPPKNQVVFCEQLEKFLSIKEENKPILNYYAPVLAFQTLIQLSPSLSPGIGKSINSYCTVAKNNKESNIKRFAAMAKLAAISVWSPTHATNCLEPLIEVLNSQNEELSKEVINILASLLSARLLPRQSSMCVIALINFCKQPPSWPGYHLKMMYNKVPTGAQEIKEHNALHLYTENGKLIYVAKDLSGSVRRKSLTKQELGEKFDTIKESLERSHPLSDDLIKAIFESTSKNGYAKRSSHDVHTRLEFHVPNLSQQQVSACLKDLIANLKSDSIHLSYSIAKIINKLTSKVDLPLVQMRCYEEWLVKLALKDPSEISLDSNSWAYLNKDYETPFRKEDYKSYRCNAARLLGYIFAAEREENVDRVLQNFTNAVDKSAKDYMRVMAVEGLAEVSSQLSKPTTFLLKWVAKILEEKRTNSIQNKVFEISLQFFDYLPKIQLDLPYFSEHDFISLSKAFNWYGPLASGLPNQYPSVSRLQNQFSSYLNSLLPSPCPLYLDYLEKFMLSETKAQSENTFSIFSMLVSFSPSQHKLALNLISRLLKHEQEHIRANTVEALGQIISNLKEASVKPFIDLLFKALEDKEENVRRKATNEILQLPINLMREYKSLLVVLKKYIEKESGFIKSIINSGLFVIFSPQDLANFMNHKNLILLWNQNKSGYYKDVLKILPINTLIELYAYRPTPTLLAQIGYKLFVEQISIFRFNNTLYIQSSVSNSYIAPSQELALDLDSFIKDLPLEVSRLFPNFPSLPLSSEPSASELSSQPLSSERKDKPVIGASVAFPNKNLATRATVTTTVANDQSQQSSFTSTGLSTSPVRLLSRSSNSQAPLSHTRQPSGQSRIASLPQGQESAQSSPSSLSKKETKNAPKISSPVALPSRPSEQSNLRSASSSPTSTFNAPRSNNHPPRASSNSSSLFSNNSQSAKSDDKQNRFSLYKVEDKNAWFISNSLSKLPLEVGSAYSQGDCFFDSVAQALVASNIAIPGDSGMDPHKKLRVLCRTQVIEARKNSKESWLADLITKDGDNLDQYILNIRFTAQEIEREFKAGRTQCSTAIWGRSHIEGRIICAALSVKIHLLELQEVDGQLIPIHQLVDATSSKTIDEADVNYQDKQVMHIAGYKLHFVPMFKRSIPLEENHGNKPRLQIEHPKGPTHG